MDDDIQTPTNCEDKPDEERQNRRQFFNGLGKWSLAIIAAVAAVGGSKTGAQASRENAPKSNPEAERPAWAVLEDRNPRAKMAGYFKRRPHGNYTKTHNQHIDFTYHRSIQ
jgi:hypothetical protein